MNKKKKPSFIAVYFAAVSAFILICIVVYVVLAVMLNNYEAGAEARRIAAAEESEAIARADEESRAAESERIKNELENERLRNEADFRKRQSAVSAASEAAAAAIKNAAKELSAANSESYLSRLIVQLSENGPSPLCQKIGGSLCEYERDGALESYIGSLPGGYGYTKLSDLTARITKGDTVFSVTLKETLKDGYIPEYSLDTVTCSLPLRSYTAIVPEGAELKINGKTASGAVTGKAAEYKDVPDAFDPPRVSAYECGGFLYEPVFAASLDGEELAYTKEDGVYTFVTATDDSINELYKNELTGRIFKLIFDHTDFIAGVYKFSQIKSNLYPGTSLYTALSGFDNRWYYTYEYIQNENAKLTGFTVVSDRLVKATVSYDQMLYDINGKRLRKIGMKFDLLIGIPSDPAVPDETDTDKNYTEWLLISVGNK